MSSVPEPERPLTAVIHAELTGRGWTHRATQAGQILYSKGPYVAVPDAQAVVVQMRLEAEGTDSYADWPEGQNP